MKTRKLIRNMSMVASIVLFIACSGGKQNEESAEIESASESTTTTSTTTSTTETSLSDPYGTYTDAEGGMSFTFRSTGKFYSEVLGETQFGSWQRSGSTILLTYDDGATADVTLLDDAIEFNGMRLRK